MQRTMYSGRRPINPNIVADPYSELHSDLKISAPEARATPAMPYAARTQRGRAAARHHLMYCE